MDIRYAPLEGVTDSVFRRAHHACFGGVGKYYMPFVSPTLHHVFTARELRNIAPENNAGMHAVPQVLTKDAEHFLWAAGEMAQMGYDEVNLNIGCPSGTVTAKGKGSGMLRDLAHLDEFLARVTAESPLPVSVKTRIGFLSDEEWPAILDVLAKYPLRELTIHPRTRTGFYKGELYPETFRMAYERGVPLVYNGDLFTPEDCEALQRQYPGMPMMLGRGLMSNPALGRQLAGGPGLTREEIWRFHDMLWEGYLAIYPVHLAHGRLREVMKYISCCFEDADKALKAIRKSNPDNFRDAVKRLLDCDMRQQPGYQEHIWSR